LVPELPGEEQTVFNFVRSPEGVEGDRPVLKNALLCLLDGLIVDNKAFIYLCLLIFGSVCKDAFIKMLLSYHLEVSHRFLRKINVLSDLKTAANFVLDLNLDKTLRRSDNLWLINCGHALELKLQLLW